MSRSGVLLPREYESGARVVETTLRPARPACLIPDDDPDMAARFIRSRCLAWAGQASYVIPYSRSGGLSEQWEELLRLFDPDRVFAIEPLLEAEKERLNDAGWFVYPRDEPLALSGESSTLLHSALKALADGLKTPESPYFVVVPEVPRPAAAYLHLLARFGGLDEEELKYYLNEQAPSYEYHLDLSEFVRVERVNLSRASSGVWTGDLRGLVGEEEVEHALTLPELTCMGLRITGRSRSKRARGEREVEDGYNVPVVVTGAYDSVEDFALYWNLRAEHYFARPFPLWLPLSALEYERGPAIVESALSRANEGLTVAQVRKRDVRIVSAATPTEELEERLRASYPEAHIGAGSLAELFKTTCDYHHTTEQSTAHFERGRASLRPPRPEAFKGLVPYVDRVAYDVGVEGMWLPQSKALAWHLGRSSDHAREIVSKKGTLRFVESFNKNFSEADLLNLQTPDGWDLLSSVFEDCGYDVFSTTGSKLALGQLSLVDGIEGMKVLASSRVHRLLKELSGRRGEKRAFVAERKGAEKSRFDSWGQAGSQLLSWLIKRQILFRGVDLVCPRCELKRWYEVDRVTKVWRCDGCQVDSPVPLDLGATRWQYRVNELYARGHDQGTITVLLTLHAMSNAWGRSFSREALGYYPGVRLRAKAGAAVPVEQVDDIDLVAIRGSKLILAECKESAEFLKEPEQVSKFANQLSKLYTVAHHMGASQLIVATSTRWPEEKGPLLKGVSDNSSVEIEWWDEAYVLDPHFAFPQVSYPGAALPEGWTDTYLDWVASSLTRELP